ncbi:MAG TPA: ribonuclease J, partial [Clostridiales bacterium]|nr:ribonuclease J [Clostridiales bacterium]
PDVVSRGFVYVRESEDLMQRIKDIARERVEACKRANINDWATIKTSIKNSIYKYIYEETNRTPMIIPVIMEI